MTTGASTAAERAHQAVLLCARGDPAAAAELARQALELATLADPAARGRALVACGCASVELGRAAEAIAELRVARERCWLDGDDLGEARAAAALALALQREGGDVATVLRLLGRAAEIGRAETRPSIELAELHRTLARAHAALEDHAHAAEQARTAERVGRASGAVDVHLAALTELTVQRARLAAGHLELGDRAQTVHLMRLTADAARAIATLAPTAHPRRLVANALAVAAEAELDPAAATVAAVRDAVHAAHAVTAADVAGLLAVWWAHLLLRADRLADATAAAERAVAHARLLRDGALERWGLLVLAEASARLGDDRSASAHYREAHLLGLRSLARQRDELLSLVTASSEGAPVRVEIEWTLADDERDPVSGLGTALALERRAARVLQVCHANGQPASIVTVRLEGLGALRVPTAADVVLREVGALVATALRAGDLAVHTGGGTLVVLLPGADATTARLVAERLEARLATHRWPAVCGPRPVVARTAVRPCPPGATPALLTPAG